MKYNRKAKKVLFIFERKIIEKAPVEKRSSLFGV